MVVNMANSIVNNFNFFSNNNILCGVNNVKAILTLENRYNQFYHVFIVLKAILS